MDSRRDDNGATYAPWPRPPAPPSLRGKGNQQGMSFGNLPVMRLWCAVAGVLVSSGTMAHAADRSLTGTVTDAFETVVIDATKAASKATAAAKDALSTDANAKTKRDKKAGKDSAKKDASKQDDAKTESAEDTQPGKAPGTKDPADPAAKAADNTKPADPKSDKPADAAAKKPAIPTEWPAVDVELAKARCTQLLKGVDAVSVPEAPFRKGDCGAMAPVRLISIGKNPEVSFSPPPVVSCDLVVGLTKWIKTEVQPAARRHLGSEVIRIESMSDYSCRMAYGRVGNKLSEHGKANALDIRGFITRKGDQAIVLAHWGETKRDVERRIASANAATAKAEAVRVAAAEANAARAETAAETAKAANTGSKLPRKTLVEGMPGKNQDLALPASVTKEDSVTPTLGSREDGAGNKKKRKKTDEISKQGKASDTVVAALPPAGAASVAKAAAAPPPPNTPTSRFLHAVHDAGCRIFGTTLGPEANEAHRNHFHVDMAERKVRKICD
jgi:hypothetical protein